MKTQPHNRTRWLVILVSLLCTVLVGIAPISAQGTPVTVGANITGEVTAAAPIAEYLLSVPSAQGVQIQVLALTPGFAPFFSVIDSSTGIPLLDAGVDGQATIVRGSVSLAAAIPYNIQVQSANGTFGQFVLSIQPGQAAPPAAPLTPGTPTPGTVSIASPLQQYSFTANATQIMLVNVNSINPANGPIVRLLDATSGQTLAAGSTRLVVARFGVPSGAQNYLVEVAHSGSPADEPFTVCLEAQGGTPACPGSGATVPPPASTPEPTEPPLPTQPNFQAIPIPANGPCSVAPSGASAINVRSGPSTSFSIVTQLAPNTIVPVTGRLADNSWYQVNVSGITGWVSATVVRIGGNNCGSITLITPPTPTGQAAATTSSSTATPSATATTGATATPTATNTVPAPVATLNYSLSPNYGSTSLTAGFVPDPFSVGMSSGGPVDTSYLGGGCYGYATSQPDFSVSYTSGGATLLRFYFVGSGGDTTMIINTPGASYVCVDDSFGTLNPTIDFNSPSSGRYDIWIGSYASGTNVSGTLFVTELSSNRP